MKPKDESYEFRMLQEINQAYQVHNLLHENEFILCKRLYICY